MKSRKVVQFQQMENKFVEDVAAAGRSDLPIQMEDPFNKVPAYLDTVFRIRNRIDSHIFRPWVRMRVLMKKELFKARYSLLCLALRRK